MLTAQGFGNHQAPFAGELAEYVVLRGIVLNGPKKAGDTIQLNPKSQIAIELSALGKIKKLPDAIIEQAPVEITNRAVGVENGVEAPVRRGRKLKNG